MAQRGYVVLAIDQLGAGASSKPDGDFFSLDEAASALHQVARYIRTAAPGGCTKLAYVGHSNGSVTSIYAQATYGDADGLVTTGWVHGFRDLPLDPTNPDVQAAVATPYINLHGPIRSGLMYYAPGTASDPAMVAYDDANLVTRMPRHQFFDLIGVHADITALGPGGMTTLTRSQGVKVPVMVQAGDHDDHIAPASAALAAPTEQAFYSSAPDFELQVLTNIGHCVNLHYDHEQSWDGIDDWIQRMLD
jgi:pimeloyl-ACP methyl ester carboxylesterase